MLRDPETYNNNNNNNNNNYNNRYSQVAIGCKAEASGKRSINENDKGEKGVHVWGKSSLRSLTVASAKEYKLLWVVLLILVLMSFSSHRSTGTYPSFGTLAASYNFTCFGLLPNDTNVCSGGGICIGQDRCLCDHGRFEANCFGRICETHNVTYWGRNDGTLLGCLPHSVVEFIPIPFTNVSFSQEFPIKHIVMRKIDPQTGYIITTNHSLYVWGSNLERDLGLGSGVELRVLFSLPQEIKVDGVNGWNDVCVGSRHTAALTLDHELYQWGRMSSDLGGNSFVPRHDPDPIDFLDGEYLYRVGCGPERTFLVTNLGRTFGRGDNLMLSLGTGQFSQETFKLIDSLEGHYITKIASSFDVTLFHTADDILFCAGRKSHCGIGSTADNQGILPQIVSNATVDMDVSGVAENAFAVFITLEDTEQRSGYIHTFGTNRYGSLLGQGEDFEIDRLAPSPLLVNITDKEFTSIQFRHVSIGFDFMSAISVRDEIFSWGRSELYQLGIGPNPPVSSPLPVQALFNGSNYATIVSGYYGSLVITGLCTTCNGTFSTSSDVCSGRGLCIRNDFCEFCREFTDGNNCEFKYKEKDRISQVFVQTNEPSGSYLSAKYETRAFAIVGELVSVTIEIDHRPLISPRIAPRLFLMKRLESETTFEDLPTTRDAKLVSKYAHELRPFLSTNVSSPVQGVNNIYLFYKFDSHGDFNIAIEPVQILHLEKKEIQIQNRTGFHSDQYHTLEFNYMNSIDFPEAEIQLMKCKFWDIDRENMTYSSSVVKQAYIYSEEGNHTRFTCPFELPNGRYRVSLWYEHRFENHLQISMNGSQDVVVILDKREMVFVQRDAFVATEGGQVTIRHETNQDVNEEDVGRMILIIDTGEDVFNATLDKSSGSISSSNYYISSQINGIANGTHNISIAYVDTLNQTLILSSNILRMHWFHYEPIKFSTSSVHFTTTKSFLIYQKIMFPFSEWTINNMKCRLVRINEPVIQYIMDAKVEFEDDQINYTCFNNTSEEISRGIYNVDVIYYNSAITDPNTAGFNISISPVDKMSIFEQGRIQYESVSALYSRQEQSLTVVQPDNDQYYETESNLRCKLVPISVPSTFKNGTIYTSLNLTGKSYECNLPDLPSSLFNVSLTYLYLDKSEGDVSYNQHYPLSTNSLHVHFLDREEISFPERNAYHSDTDVQIAVNHNTGQNLTELEQETQLRCVFQHSQESSIKYIRPVNRRKPSNPSENFYNCDIQQQNTIPNGYYSFSFVFLDPANDNLLPLSKQDINVSFYDLRTLSLTNRSIYEANSSIDVEMQHASNQTFLNGDESYIKCRIEKDLFNTTFNSLDGVNQYICHLPSQPHGNYSISLIYLNEPWKYELVLSTNDVEIRRFQVDSTISFVEKKVYNSETNIQVKLIRDSEQPLDGLKCKVNETFYDGSHSVSPQNNQVHVTCHIGPKSMGRYDLSLWIVDEESFQNYSLPVSIKKDMYLFNRKDISTQSSAYSVEGFNFTFTYHNDGNVPVEYDPKLFSIHCLFEKISSGGKNVTLILNATYDQSKKQYICEIPKQEQEGTYQVSFIIIDKEFYPQATFLSVDPIKFVLLRQLEIIYIVPFAFKTNITHLDPSHQVQLNTSLRITPDTYDSDLIRYECRFRDDIHQRIEKSNATVINTDIFGKLMNGYQLACPISSQSKATVIHTSLWIVTTDSLQTEYELSQSSVPLFFTDEIEAKSINQFVDSFSSSESSKQYQQNITLSKGKIHRCLEKGLYCKVTYPNLDVRYFKAQIPSWFPSCEDSLSSATTGSNSVHCNIDISRNQLQLESSGIYGSTVNISIVLDRVYHEEHENSRIDLSNNSVYFIGFNSPLRFLEHDFKFIKEKHSEETSQLSFNVPSQIVIDQLDIQFDIQNYTLIPNSQQYDQHPKSMKCTFNVLSAASCNMEQPYPIEHLPTMIHYTLVVTSHEEFKYSFNISGMVYVEHTVIYRMSPYILGFGEHLDKPKSVLIGVNQKLNYEEFNYFCVLKGMSSKSEKKFNALWNSTQTQQPVNTNVLFGITSGATLVTCDVTTFGSLENANVSLVFEHKGTAMALTYRHSLSKNTHLFLRFLSVLRLLSPRISPMNVANTLKIQIPNYPVSELDSNYDFFLKFLIRGAASSLNVRNCIKSQIMRSKVFSNTTNDIDVLRLSDEYHGEYIIELKCEIPSLQSEIDIPSHIDLVRASIDMYLDNQRVIRVQPTYMFYRPPELHGVLPSPYIEKLYDKSLTLRGKRFRSSQLNHGFASNSKYIPLIYQFEDKNVNISSKMNVANGQKRFDHCQFLNTEAIQCPSPASLFHQNFPNENYYGDVTVYISFNGVQYHKFDKIIHIYNEDTIGISALSTYSHNITSRRIAGENGLHIYGNNFFEPRPWNNITAEIYDSLVRLRIHNVHFINNQTLYIPPEQLHLDLWNMDIAFPRNLHVSINFGDFFITNEQIAIRTNAPRQLEIVPRNSPVGSILNTIHLKNVPRIALDHSRGESYEFFLVNQTYSSILVPVKCNVNPMHNESIEMSLSCRTEQIFDSEPASMQLMMYIRSNSGISRRVYIAQAHTFFVHRKPVVERLEPKIVQPNQRVKIVGHNFFQSDSIMIRISVIETTDNTPSTRFIHQQHDVASNVTSRIDVQATYVSESMLEMTWPAIPSGSSFTLSISMNGGFSTNPVDESLNKTPIPRITLDSSSAEYDLTDGREIYVFDGTGRLNIRGTNLNYFDLVKDKTFIEINKDNIFSFRYRADELDAGISSLTTGGSIFSFRFPRLDEKQDSFEKLTFPTNIFVRITFDNFETTVSVQLVLTNSIRQPLLATLWPQTVSQSLSTVELTLSGRFFDNNTVCYVEETGSNSSSSIQYLPGVLTYPNGLKCILSLGEESTDIIYQVRAFNNFTKERSLETRVLIAYRDPNIVSVNPSSGMNHGRQLVTLQLQGLNAQLLNQYRQFMSIGCRFGSNPCSEPCRLVSEDSDTTASINCMQPALNPGNFLISLTYDSRHFFGAVSFRVIGCKAGYGTISYTEECRPCSPGTFNDLDLISARECRQCGFNTFSDEYGLRSCKRCPLESSTLDITGADSPLYCACNNGTIVNRDLSVHDYLYHARKIQDFTSGNSSSLGDEEQKMHFSRFHSRCLNCPIGGECPFINTTQPLARRGYWYKPDSIQFYSCFPRESCPGFSALTCSEGYEGLRCGLCSEGFYKMKGRCLKCQDNVWVRFLVVALVCALVGVAFFGLSSIKVTHLGSLSIGLFMFQVISMFSNFDINWPPIMGIYFTGTSASNFNMDFISLQCLFPGMTYVGTFYLMMAFPPIFVICLILSYFAAEFRSICASLVERIVFKGDSNKKKFRYYKPIAPLNMVLSKNLLKQISKINKFKYQVGRLCKNILYWCYNFIVWFFTQHQEREEMKIFRDKVVNAICTFVSFSFIFMMSTASEIFVCTQQSDGTSTLNKSPNIVCWQSQEWFTMLPISISYFVIVGGGSALFFLILITKKFIFRKQLNGRRYRFVLKRFKEKSFYFEAVITLRKLLISILQIFFHPVWVIVLSLAIVFASTILHMSVIPFKRKFHNLMEYYALLGTLMSLFFGLVIFFEDNQEIVRQVAVVCSILVIVVSSIVIFAMIVWDIFTRRKKEGKKMKRKKSRKLSKAPRNLEYLKNDTTKHIVRLPPLTPINPSDPYHFTLKFFKPDSSSEEENNTKSINEIVDELFNLRRFRRKIFLINRKKNRILKKLKKKIIDKIFGKKKKAEQTAVEQVPSLEHPTGLQEIVTVNENLQIEVQAPATAAPLSLSDDSTAFGIGSPVSAPSDQSLVPHHHYGASTSNTSDLISPQPVLSPTSAISEENNTTETSTTNLH